LFDEKKTKGQKSRARVSLKDITICHSFLTFPFYSCNNLSGKNISRKSAHAFIVTVVATKVGLLNSRLGAGGRAAGAA
jgi:hypothetical protein